MALPEMGFQKDEAVVNVDEKDINDLRIKNGRIANPPEGVMPGCTAG